MYSHVRGLNGKDLASLTITSRILQLFFMSLHQVGMNFRSARRRGSAPFAARHDGNDTGFSASLLQRKSCGSIHTGVRLYITYNTLPDNGRSSHVIAGYFSAVGRPNPSNARHRAGELNRQNLGQHRPASMNDQSSKRNSDTSSFPSHRAVRLPE